jgi:hypothetical protein
MRRALAVIAAAAILGASACHHVHREFVAFGPPSAGHPGEAPSRRAERAVVVNTNCAFCGGVSNVSIGQCAGRIALENGSATVKDTCFTGDTNVVVCTDATAANPIRCTPGNGQLSISGSANDVISYVRVDAATEH